MLVTVELSPCSAVGWIQLWQDSWKVRGIIYGETSAARCRNDEECRKSV